jgi:hypothetical protein
VAAWVAGADVVVTTAEVVAAPVPDSVEEAPPELEGFFPTQLVSATKYCQLTQRAQIRVATYRQ